VDADEKSERSSPPASNVGVDDGVAQPDDDDDPADGMTYTHKLRDQALPLQGCHLFDARRDSDIQCIGDLIHREKSVEHSTPHHIPLPARCWPLCRPIRLLLIACVCVAPFPPPPTPPPLRCSLHSEQPQQRRRRRRGDSEEMPAADVHQGVKGKSPFYDLPYFKMSMVQYDLMHTAMGVLSTFNRAYSNPRYDDTLFCKQAEREKVSSQLCTAVHPHSTRAQGRSCTPHAPS
jgi:hypothetical protein